MVLPNFERRVGSLTLTDGPALVGDTGSAHDEADPAFTLKLDTLRQGTVDHKICPRSEAGCRARKKYDAAGDFFRFRHTPSGIQSQRLCVEARHVGFDVLPNATIEISISR